MLLDTALDGIKPCSIPKLKETVLNLLKLAEYIVVYIFYVIKSHFSFTVAD